MLGVSRIKGRTCGFIQDGEINPKQTDRANLLLVQGEHIREVKGALFPQMHFSIADKLPGSWHTPQHTHTSLTCPHLLSQPCT